MADTTTGFTNAPHSVADALLPLTIAPMGREAPRPILAIYSDGVIEQNGTPDELDDALARLATSFARACHRPEHTGEPRL